MRLCALLVHLLGVDGRDSQGQDVCFPRLPEDLWPPYGSNRNPSQIILKPRFQGPLPRAWGSLSSGHPSPSPPLGTDNNNTLLL